MAKNKTAIGTHIVKTEITVDQFITADKVLKAAKKAGYSRVIVIGFREDEAMEVCTSNLRMSDTNADLDCAKKFILDL